MGLTYPITRQTQSAEAVMPKQVVFCRSRSFETRIEYYACKCRRWRRGHGIFTTAQCDVTRGKGIPPPIEWESKRGSQVRLTVVANIIITRIEGIILCGWWRVECGVYEHVYSFMWLKLSGVWLLHCHSAVMTNVQELETMIMIPTLIMDAIGYMVSFVRLDQSAVISELLGNALPVAVRCINHDYTNCNSIIDGTNSRNSIKKPVASKMRPGEELNEHSKKKKEISGIFNISVLSKKKKTDIMEIKTEDNMERQMIALMKDMKLNVVGCNFVVYKIQSVLQQNCRKKPLMTSCSGTQHIIIREDREVREDESKLFKTDILNKKKDEKNENDSMSNGMKLILLGFVSFLIIKVCGAKMEQRKNSI